MTRFVHDRFAKDLLEEVFLPSGNVNRSRDVTAEVRQIDMLFVPNTTPPPQLGWLGEMGRTSAMFEPFRNPAAVDEICNCISKLFDYHAECQRQAKREGISLKRGDLCQLWILTPTASKALLSDFGGKIKERQGIHYLPAGFKSAIVVIHQLPRTPETLWLRLLGRGTVQQGAIAELKALPDGTAFKDRVLELLSNLFTTLNTQNDLGSEDRELMVQLSPLYLERIEEATQQGIERGTVSVVLRQLRRRVGTIAPEVEERIRGLSVDRVEDLGEALLDFEGDADLQRWFDLL